MKALNCLQYAYGRYILNLNINREIHLLQLHQDKKKLYKLKQRIQLTQMLMPSKYSNDYYGTEIYHFDFSNQEYNNLYYTDRHGLPQYGKPEDGNTKEFIEKVHKCCEEYLPLLEKVKLGKELSDSEKQEEVISHTLEDIYDFLKIHFQIDVKKELFISEENFSNIIISGISNKLSKKELTKYQIGYLFEYFLQEFNTQKNRVMFSYKGQGHNENIDYQEAIKALNDKRIEIKSGKTTNRNLMRFADNLKKEFNIFLENRITYNS